VNEERRGGNYLLLFSKRGFHKPIKTKPKGSFEQQLKAILKVPPPQKDKE